MKKSRWMIILIGFLLSALVGYYYWKYFEPSPADNRTWFASSNVVYGTALTTLMVIILTSPRQTEN